MKENKEMYMEDVNSIVVETLDFLESKLMKFEKLLSVEDSDELFDNLQELIEQYSNGIYANHN